MKNWPKANYGMSEPKPPKDWSEAVRNKGFCDEDLFAITEAIAEAGYAVVPLEPTEAMARDGARKYAN